MTRYRCLVLDHDDTSVQSTPTVHYPAYVETMRRLRPQLTPATREEFIRLWFESRFMETCRDVYHFTPEEMQLQDDNWKEFMQQRVPEFFDGLPQIILCALYPPGLCRGGPARAKRRAGLGNWGGASKAQPRAAGAADAAV